MATSALPPDEDAPAAAAELPDDEAETLIGDDVERRHALTGNVGPYRVLEPLGAGGMGEVYLAQDPRLQRQVALKRVATSLLAMPEARPRLLKEARAAAALSHPNVATVHDVIDWNDEPIIVMEYVEGTSLKDRLEDGPLAVSDAIELAIQMASALEEAHRHDIVHRDLKPANVMITAAGTVKILDFGLARSVSPGGSTLTATGQAVGTPAYMAPEQALGRLVDQRADIYSLGLVLFELLAGQRPSQRNIVAKDQLKEPRVEELRPEAPSELGDIVSKAMAWEPAERHQSASQLRAELLRVKHKHLEEQTEVTGTDGAPRFPRRQAMRRFIGWTAGLLAVLVAAALVYSKLRPPPIAQGAVVAVLPLQNVSGDPSLDHIGVAIAHALTSQLARLPTITTVSRTTSREYANEDTERIARDFGASFVVNGSVQGVAESLNITANLVRADDTVAWGDQFEGATDELFDLQRRLAAELTKALRLRLTPQQQQRLDVPPTADTEAYAEYSQGRYFIERAESEQDLDYGIRLLKSALVDRDEGFALAWAALGEAYWARFEMTSGRDWTVLAREAAERARQLDPDHPSVHYVLAVVYHGSGESSRAMTELRRALELQPNYDDAYRLIGESLAEQGDIEGAAAELQHAIAIRPDFWGHHRALGMAYFRAGLLNEAVTAFERVTELQPDLAVGFQMLGAAYHTMGELEHAQTNYEKSIELSPTAATLNNLGTIYYRLEDFEAAARSYREALTLQPNRAITHRNLGDVLKRLGEEQGSRAAYEQAAEIHLRRLEVNPLDAREKALLGLMEAKLQNYDTALRLVAEARALSESDPQVLYHSGVVQTLAGKRFEAVATLRLAIESGFGVSEIRADDATWMRCDRCHNSTGSSRGWRQKSTKRTFKLQGGRSDPHHPTAHAGTRRRFDCWLPTYK